MPPHRMPRPHYLPVKNGGMGVTPLGTSSGVSSRWDDALVMPPLEPLEPPRGDIAPYPNSVLDLGDGRYLAMSGDVVTSSGYCEPVQVQPNTRWYWEGRAAKAGYTLDELLSSHVPGTD